MRKETKRGDPGKRRENAGDVVGNSLTIVQFSHERVSTARRILFLGLLEREAEKQRSREAEKQRSRSKLQVEPWKTRPPLQTYLTNYIYHRAAVQGPLGPQSRSSS